MMATIIGRERDRCLPNGIERADVLDVAGRVEIAVNCGNGPGERQQCGTGATHCHPATAAGGQEPSGSTDF